MEEPPEPGTSRRSQPSPRNSHHSQAPEFLDLQHQQDWELKALTRPRFNLSELGAFLRDTSWLMSETSLEVKVRTAKAFTVDAVLKRFQQVFEHDWVDVKSFSEPSYVDHVLPTLHILAKVTNLSGKLSIQVQTAMFSRLFQTKKVAKEVLRKILFSIKFLYSIEDEALAQESILLSLLVFKLVFIELYRENTLDDCDLREMAIRLVMLIPRLKFKADGDGDKDRENARRDAKGIATLFSLSDDIRIQSLGPLKIYTSKAFLKMMCPNDNLDFCPFGEDWCCFKHEREIQGEVKDRIQQDGVEAAKVAQKKETEAEMIKRRREKKDRGIVEFYIKNPELELSLEHSERYGKLVAQLRAQGISTVTDLEINLNFGPPPVQIPVPRNIATEDPVKEQPEGSDQIKPVTETRGVAEDPELSNPEPEFDLLDLEEDAVIKPHEPKCLITENPKLYSQQDLTSVQNEVYQRMEKLGISKESPLQNRPTPLHPPEELSTFEALQRERDLVEGFIKIEQRDDTIIDLLGDSNEEKITSPPKFQSLLDLSDDEIFGYHFAEELPAHSPSIPPLDDIDRDLGQPLIQFSPPKTGISSSPKMKSPPKLSVGTAALTVPKARSTISSAPGPPVVSNVRLDCGHTVKRMRLEEFEDLKGYKCKELMVKRNPVCNHRNAVECWYNLEEDQDAKCELCERWRQSARA